jgi:CheY-like chemotaxis protein
MSQNTPATVLVVDDERKNVTLLTDLLESRNYTVWSAPDGRGSPWRATASPMLCFSTY